ncbi:MAG: hypothetical protein ABI779_22705 [Acidobacteriota bacterium]
MTTENEIRRPRRWLRGFFKYLALTLMLIVTILVAAHFAWKYSGSNRWVKVIDKNGIQVYTLKSPGQVLKRFRGVTHVKTKLAAAVDLMMQTDTKDCSDWFPGCTSVQAIQPWNPQDLTYIHLFRLKAFRPFAPRETLLKGRATQDPVTKSVLIEFMAMPDDLPPNDCCFRVSHMHNTWRYTPQANGEVEVEVRMNVDLGLPYVMFNRFIPGGVYKTLSRLPKYVDNERWQKAQFDSIQEVN